MNVHQQQKQLAWQSAFEMRACPTENILFSNTNKPELKAHISFCKICQEKIKTSQDDKKLWGTLSEKLTMKFTSHPTDSTPEPGQVWSLSHKLNDWSPSNLYYKAPKVLLLERIENSENGFKAAQLFSSPELMGPNDVWLSERFGFVELWNNYSIHKRHLEICWGAAPQNTFINALSELAKFESEISNSSAVQEYAPEGSIRYQFRNLESEVGSYFALKSVSVLVEEYQNAAAWAVILEKAKEFYKNAKNVLQGIGDFAGELLNEFKFPEPDLQLLAAKERIGEEGAVSNLLLSFFGQATPAEPYALSMAASCASEHLFSANFLKLTSTGLTLSQAIVELEPPGWDEQGLLIIGKVRDVSPDEVKAWWIIEGREPIPATTLTYNEDKTLEISFDGLDELQQKNVDTSLKLLLVGYDK